MKMMVENGNSIKFTRHITAIDWLPVCDQHLLTEGMHQFPYLHCLYETL